MRPGVQSAVLAAAVLCSVLPDAFAFVLTPSRYSRVGGSISPKAAPDRPSLTHHHLRSTTLIGGGKKATMLQASSESDLLVIGAGVLGGMLIEQHKECFAEATVIAETMSTDKHAALQAKGAICRTKEDPPTDPMPNVVFCAAPGKNPDYPGEVRKALARWSGSGKFVFTSSGGVYAEDDGRAVDEESPVSDSARAKKLLECERAVLQEGGTVVRLAGLYTLERGAHNYWCKVGSVEGRADGLIGLVSYEDAAGSVVAVLSADRAKVAGEIFLICDGKEQTRKDICEAALGTAFYKDSAMPEFKGSTGPIGKRYDISKAKSILGWSPRHESFHAFCGSNKDVPAPLGVE